MAAKTMAPAARSAFEQGKEARRDGAPKDQNPFNWFPGPRGNALSAWWSKGWQEADQSSGKN